MSRKFRRYSLVVLVAVGLSWRLVGAEFTTQPADRTSYLLLADGGRVYDAELAARVAELVEGGVPAGPVFVFTQCSSGGMLDELAAALPGPVNAALFSASRYDESAWMAASWDPPGCLRGSGLSRPESYFAWALARLIEQGLPLGEVAEQVEELDAAAPGGPATDPTACPGESLVDPPGTSAKRFPRSREIAPAGPRAFRTSYPSFRSGGGVGGGGMRIPLPCGTI